MAVLAHFGTFDVENFSDLKGATYLQEFTRLHTRFSLHRNDEPLGYTRAANLGLGLSTAELGVLVNSDAIVTNGWLERAIECMRSDPAIGIVGPLSNAASYQSVPERPGEGDWSQNPLPAGWSIDRGAAAVAQVFKRTFPLVPFVNGFCFAIKRAVIEAIGDFDEASFPDGYGEEVDYCLRATKAGFDLAVANHAYVYHAANRSYGPEQREALKLASRAAQLRKHKPKRIRAAIAKTAEEPTLERMREGVAHALSEKPLGGSRTRQVNGRNRNLESLIYRGKLNEKIQIA